jgi:hypothetical protein
LNLDDQIDDAVATTVPATEALLMRHWDHHSDACGYNSSAASAAAADNHFACAAGAATALAPALATSFNVAASSASSASPSFDTRACDQVVAPAAAARGSSPYAEATSFLSTAQNFHDMYLQLHKSVEHFRAVFAASHTYNALLLADNKRLRAALADQQAASEALLHTHSSEASAVDGGFAAV